MALTDIVKKVESLGKSLGSSVRKYAGISAFVAGAYLGNNARADGPDPSTECALSTVVCVAPTDDWRTTAQNALNLNKNVYLTDGNLNTEEDYVFASPSAQPLMLNASDKVYGENRFNTSISRDGTGVIFGISGDGNTVKDMTVSNAFEPVKIIGTSYDNVTLENINFENAGAQPIFFDKSEKPGNSAPNMHFVGILVDGGQLGIHVNNGANGDPVSEDTKYPRIVNSAFTNIRNEKGHGLVIDAPYDIANNLYKVTIINSTLTNSDDNWTEEALTVWANPPSTAGSEFGPPTYMIEWDNTGDTLVDRNIMTNVNKEANPMLTPSGRPILDRDNPNPAVSPEYPNGHNGPLYSAGDFNENNRIDLTDLMKFDVEMSNPNPTRKTLSFFDFNGDQVINLTDRNRLIQGMETSEIPAASTWGLTTLVLGTLISGTLILRNKKYNLTKTSN